MSPRPYFFSRAIRGHLLDGVAICPMLLLAASPFFKGLADELLKHDSAVLAVAGIVSVLAVMEPERPSPNSKDAS